MESTSETAPANGRSSRTRPSNQSPAAGPPTYGYHNTFHTHAQLPLGPPPSYARANDPSVLVRLHDRSCNEAHLVHSTPLPPAYDCSIEIDGFVGIKQELSSPFLVAGHREWGDAYVLLRGTQLSIHRPKLPNIFSKHQQPTPGKLLRTYSLQHAEVGIASDFKKTALLPKSPFAHLVPASARPKLYETDPHLFEPVREYAIRLRLELEQFLLCPPTEKAMLDWVEALTAAIDISSPLEDRSEPRYRSLPRRSRRQRLLDSAQFGENMDNLSSLEAGRRIIAQQEQIIRQLYPHLAGTQEPGTTTTAPAAENELDDFDPEDVRFPTRPARDSLAHVSSRDDETWQSNEDRTSNESADPKSAPRIRPTPSQTLRYRRRCAPVLLACSPRVSDVVFSEGKRLRISLKEHALVEYTSHPPRYDVHGFPKTKRPAKVAITTQLAPIVLAPARPSSPMRSITDDSMASMSFGEVLAPAQSSADEAGSSGPPSPTKIDATHQLTMSKRRTSEESRDNHLSAVTLGVGLLI
ncbi:hypothetical protein ACN47E_006332 [Coniothyrium glycines]